MTVGWYLLPDCGFPFHGPIPDGVDEISEDEAVRTYRGIVDDAARVVPVDQLTGDTLASVRVEDLERRLADVDDAELIERLIRDEYAGRHRAGAIKALERRRAQLEEGEPAS